MITKKLNNKVHLLKLQLNSVPGTKITLAQTPSSPFPQNGLFFAEVRHWQETGHYSENDCNDFTKESKYTVCCNHKIETSKLLLNFYFLINYFSKSSLIFSYLEVGNLSFGFFIKIFWWYYGNIVVDELWSQVFKCLWTNKKKEKIKYHIR